MKDSEQKSTEQLVSDWQLVRALERMGGWAEAVTKELEASIDWLGGLVGFLLGIFMLCALSLLPVLGLVDGVAFVSKRWYRVVCEYEHTVGSRVALAVLFLLLCVSFLLLTQVLGWEWYWSPVFATPLWFAASVAVVRIAALGQRERERLEQEKTEIVSMIEKALKGQGGD